MKEFNKKLEEKVYDDLLDDIMITSLRKQYTRVYNKIGTKALQPIKQRIVEIINYSSELNKKEVINILKKEILPLFQKPT